MTDYLKAGEGNFGRSSNIATKKLIEAETYVVTEHFKDICVKWKEKAVKNAFHRLFF